MLLPIVQRELLCAARRPMTYWSRSAAVGLGVLALFPIMWQQQWSWISAAALGVKLITQLEDIAYYFTLVGGVWLTAGTVCKERSEGTLGLLFLTDLQARDVVFGKLAAAMMQIGFGLLALMPFFMICALFGGVTAMSVVAIGVKLFTTLLLSLSVGLMASAFCQIERQAMLLSGVVIYLLCFLPARIFGDHFPLSCFGAHHSPPILALGYVLQNGLPLDGLFFFTFDLLVPLGLPLLLLAITWWWLGRTWRKQESRLDTPEITRSPWLARRLKSRRLRDENPFQWLATRWTFRRVGLWLIFALISVILGGYLLFSPTKQNFAADLAVGMLFFLIVPALFLWVAVEATNQLSLERSQGTLELLLTTRMDAEEVLHGQVCGIFLAYSVPITVVFLLIGAVAFVVDNHALIRLAYDSDDLAKGLFFFFAVLFLTQITALIWVGMWRALATKSSGKALLQTLLAVFVLPVGTMLLATPAFMSTNLAFQIGPFQAGFSDRLFAALVLNGGYSMFLALWAWMHLNKALANREALLGST